MTIPIQITFRHMDSSPAVEARIRDEASALSRYFDRITSCRVVVEPPPHQQKGSRRFHVTVDIMVPGSEIVAKNEPSHQSLAKQSGEDDLEKHLEMHPEHKDVYVAIRDAFQAARRQLEDYARKLRGEVKRHGDPLEAAL